MERSRTAWGSEHGEAHGDTHGPMHTYLGQRGGAWQSKASSIAERPLGGGWPPLDLMLQLWQQMH